MHATKSRYSVYARGARSKAAAREQWTGPCTNNVLRGRERDTRLSSAAVAAGSLLPLPLPEGRVAGSAGSAGGLARRSAPTANKRPWSSLSSAAASRGVHPPCTLQRVVREAGRAMRWRGSVVTNV